MKNTNYLLVMLCILILGCKDKNLDAAKATELIMEEKEFPKILDHDIFCGDPAHAKRMLDAGFEEKGFVSIMHVRTLNDIGKPFITFKHAAKPYLLPTPPEDRNYKIQKVKIGTEEFDKVLDVSISSDGKKAIATYSTNWRTNIFAELRNGIPKRKEHKAYFILTDQGWKKVKVQDFELLELNLTR